TYDGGIQRDFHTFKATHRLPRSVYALDGLDPELQVVAAAWRARPLTLAFVVAYRGLAAGVFVARRWTTGSMKRLERIHNLFLLASFLLLGVWLHLQPSITQLLTLLGSASGT